MPEVDEADWGSISGISGIGTRGRGCRVGEALKASDDSVLAFICTAGMPTGSVVCGLMNESRGSGGLSLRESKCL